MGLRGIDISKWQANIDIASLGADFVIAKATQGTFYVDPSCDRHYQIAKALGKKLGVYHYASGGDPIQEADFFVDNIKGYLNEAIIVLDWESYQNARFGEHASWCLAFLARVYQRTSTKGVIYMSASVLRLADWSSLVRNDYGLWIAGYPDLRNSWDAPDFPYDTTPWNFWALWQYTNSDGALDRDLFAGDHHAWDLYANVKFVTPQPLPPAPEPAPIPIPQTIPEPTPEPAPVDSQPVNNTQEEDTTMSETPKETTIPTPNHMRGLSDEEFAALQKASAFEIADGWKPTIPDNIRLIVYLASGIGTPLVTLVYQLLAVYGIVPTDLAIQVIAVVASFFGTVAGLFGISHFTRSK